MPAPAPTVPLAHGAAMPRLGLGTFPLRGEEVRSVVRDAIAMGYRLIDTAENYRNEEGIGQGIADSGVARDELFVTTKFNKEWHGADLVGSALAGSLERLGLDYVDLLLIHWPNPAHDRYVPAWEGMQALLADGRVRAVGTSNFKPAHLDRLLAETGVAPDVNQIQLNPTLTRDATRSYAEQHDIRIESWAPIGGERTDVLGRPEVVALADKYGRTPAQVVLRWHLELGLIPVPKSANRERLQANLDVFDFTLQPADVAALSALDRGESAAADSDRIGH